MPWNSTMPTDFQDGQNVDEGDLDPIVNNITHLRNEVVQIKQKPLDQVVNNSTTFVDDTDLQIILLPNTIYTVEFEAVYNSGATPGFKTQYVVPAGTTGLIAGMGANAFNGNNLTAVLNWGGAGAERWIRALSRVTTTGTGGIMKLTWAQQTANATNTTLRSMSILRATIIG